MKASSTCGVIDRFAVGLRLQRRVAMRSALRPAEHVKVILTVCVSGSGPRRSLRVLLIASVLAAQRAVDTATAPDPC
jgi:hypothetical protein